MERQDTIVLDSYIAVERSLRCWKEFRIILNMSQGIFILNQRFSANFPVYS